MNAMNAMTSGDNSTASSSNLDYFQVKIGDKVVEVKPVTPVKFEPTDPKALEYFDTHGYVVFSKLASEEESKIAINLFWDHMEAETKIIKRDDYDTWKQWFSGASGVVASYAIGHSKFLWYCRSLPKVLAAFHNMWGTDDLLSSFDGCGTFRPPEINSQWKTKAGWFHVDQNGYEKPNKICTQGLLNLMPSDAEDGGFILVPDSQKSFGTLFETRKDLPQNFGDYIPLSKTYYPEIWEGRTPSKICLDVGDFVMWDSRTVHCNHPAIPKPDRKDDPVKLRRLVAYICMTPTSFCKDLSSLLKQRVFAYQNGITTSHWPHEFYASSDPYSSDTFKHIELTDTQKQLVVGKYNLHVDLLGRIPMATGYKVYYK